MSRRPPPFDRFCRAAFDLLDGEGIPFLVVGGLAVLVLGEPRLTADVDVIAFLDAGIAAAFLDRCSRDGMDVDPKAELVVLAETGTMRIGRGPLHLDVIAASLPLEDDMRRRARRVRMFGRHVLVPTAEDLLVLKVVAGRDKDIFDAIGIVRRHIARLDVAQIGAALRQIDDLAEDTSASTRFQNVLRRATDSNG